MPSEFFDDLVARAAEREQPVWPLLAGAAETQMSAHAEFLSHIPPDPLAELVGITPYEADVVGRMVDTQLKFRMTGVRAGVYTLGLDGDRERYEKDRAAFLLDEIKGRARKLNYERKFMDCGGHPAVVVFMEWAEFELVESKPATIPSTAPATIPSTTAPSTSPSTAAPGLLGLLNHTTS